MPRGRTSVRWARAHWHNGHKHGLPTLVDHRSIDPGPHDQLPGNISPIILIISLSLLPNLDQDLWDLPIVLLSWFKDDIQRSPSGLLRGQICHVAPAQIGFIY